jgi:Monomeric isocitrate dehydrogenase
VDESGTVTELRAAKPLLEGEILDATVMRMAALEKFIAEQMADAKAKGVLFSVHLKATMMKVSDPVLFGAFVRVFFKDVFVKYADRSRNSALTRTTVSATCTSAWKATPRKPKSRPQLMLLGRWPDLAMVDSAKGITNLHVPSDIIIDASMPAMIRNSGCMWNKEGKLQEVKACIPDRCYAGIYEAAIEFCKKNGAFDPKTMGTVPNVGLIGPRRRRIRQPRQDLYAKAKGSSAP